jgi:tetratricopeptide (TPR) repeat protein
VNEEIRTFRRLGKAERILCFIVDGEPNSGEQSECFPKALLAPDDLTGNVPEPVAADARPQGDGRKNAMLKIVAGMLGVGFDALKQRDHRRHQQRMITGITLSLLVTAFTITLAITATIARNDAEFRRAQAENLIDFMLVDLQEKLREIGRLDVFESVGDKALEYFAKLRAEDVSEETLAQRARNLRQIGEVNMDQGDWPAALEAFNESLLIMERLTALDRQNAGLQIDLANSHFYIGYVNWQRGALKEARLHFEIVLPIVDAVSEREPENANWLRERGRVSLPERSRDQSTGLRGQASA